MYIFFGFILSFAGLFALSYLLYFLFNAKMHPVLWYSIAGSLLLVTLFAIIHSIAQGI